MAKIIQVQDKKVSIGTEDGNFFTVNSDELNFMPSVGDEVDVFLNGGSRIISKKEKMLGQNSPTINISVPGAQKAISSKSRAVSAVLCVLLGGFGVHNFYLGKVGRGVFQAFLTVCEFILFGLGALMGEEHETMAVIFGMMGFVPLGILCIWLLIEFLMILCGSYRDGEDQLLKKW